MTSATKISRNFMSGMYFDEPITDAAYEDESHHERERERAQRRRSDEEEEEEEDDDAEEERGWQTRDYPGEGGEQESERENVRERRVSREDQVQ